MNTIANGLLLPTHPDATTAGCPVRRCIGAIRSSGYKQPGKLKREERSLFSGKPDSANNAAATRVNRSLFVSPRANLW